MMLRCFYIFIWTVVFKLFLCQRRIALGDESVHGKKYLVYFVKSPYSKTDDESWLCGGALVTSTQILTSAACLVEMERIFAIAGYKKYVKGKDINDDECTRIMKQKVIKVTVPKEYVLSSDNPAVWMNVDIGVATVEKPYNFSDLTYRTVCSYEPQTIFINYEKQYELEKTRAVVFGWGATKARNPNETSPKDINSKFLQEASTVIAEKSICARLATSDEFIKLIDKYLICTSGHGNLDGNGKDTCPNGRRFEVSNSTCVDEYFEFRRKNNNDNETSILSFKQEDDNVNETTKLDFRNKTYTTITETTTLKSTTGKSKSASPGICQNDHGGPLIRWVGMQEMIIGVALNGAYNENYECVGPFLYVSTAQAGEIIKCLLETDPIQIQVCNDKLVDKRYQVKEMEIRWPQDTNKQSNTNISSFLRQGDDELPLHMRPTKEVELDDTGNPKVEHVYEVQLNQKSTQNSKQNQNFGQINQQPKGQLQVQTKDQTLDQVYEHLYQQPREGSTMQTFQSSQIDLFKPIQESYGQPEILKQPKVDPSKQSQMGTLKQSPMPETFIPPQMPTFGQPEKLFKLPIVEPFKLSIFKKTEIPEIYDPPQLRQLEQQLSQTNPPAPVNFLRDRPSSTFDSTFDVMRDEPQSFEQMYSQLHPPAVESPPPRAPAEQTFEEMYKNLHDPTLELPHETSLSLSAHESPVSQRFGNQYEPRQKLEHRFEQSSGSRYEQQPPLQQRFEQRPSPGYQQPADQRFGQARNERPPDQRYDHPPDARTDHQLEAQYERQPEPRYERPPEAQYERPPEPPRYDHPESLRYGHPQEARYDHPPEAPYDHPTEIRYEQPPLDPKYDHPPETRYDRPPEQRYEQPSEQRYEPPPEQRYEQPPAEPRYEHPYGQGYDDRQFPQDDRMKQSYDQAPNIPQTEPVDPQDEVKVRPQVPLDYQSDTFSYANSRKRS